METNKEMLNLLKSLDNIFPKKVVVTEQKNSDSTLEKLDQAITLLIDKLDSKNPVDRERNEQSTISTESLEKSATSETRQFNKVESNTRTNESSHSSDNSKETFKNLENVIKESSLVQDALSGLFFSGMKQDLDGMRKVLGDSLKTLLDYVEKQILVGIVASSARSLITGGVTSVKDIAQVAAVKAGFSTLKASVASFDQGGIPTADGLAMVHPGDVIVNPTSDNSMMQALTQQLADKINGRMGTVQLLLDGEKIGEASIGQIRRRNSQLPNGRDVFDESRFN